MGIGKYIAAGIIGITAGIAVPYIVQEREQECKGTMIEGRCFGIGHSEIVGTYHAGSERIAAIVYDNHADRETQKNIFLTLEEMMNENNAGFVAMEYFEGEFSYDKLWENRKISFMEIQAFWRIADMPFGKREDYAVMALTDPELTLPAGTMFELVYQNKILTFGMDDWALRRNDYGPVGGQWMNDVVYGRSRAFMENITEHIEEHTETGSLIVISTGLLHRLSIEEELKNQGISYISLFLEGLEDSRGVYDRYPEQRQRTFE